MDSPIRIRRATTDDAPAVAALVASWMPELVLRPAEAGRFLDSVTLEATRTRLGDDRYAAHVAEAASRVVGMVIVRDGSHLYHLFVDAALKGRGLGRRLWETARDAARAAGHEGPFTVNASRNALPVYRALGFAATAEPVRADGLEFTPMATQPGAEGTPLAR